ncbi:solute carrier family 66 member 2 [Strongylocentrotus purpuratus]|uniref:Solute carrier family 66 member 2 n=1 Tax=Strongylocentrotus purpuratus TaxID=7668 RepID=A0A7M7N4G6_STRPU|nr:solute carrier family 66 member 2 [Strongylocentrotus purpuratus]|eukprot:XP_001183216.2 PREDICTED: PQ-loop repeat-containing protein 1 [Strongylocentrotus purpuratus]
MEQDLIKGFADLAEKKLHQVPEITLLNLVSWGASAAMIFGGIVPFIPQYLDISRSENTEGFSTHVCLVLLIANTLRILFWFGHPFELPLLAQSVIMIFTMMVVLQLCTRIKALQDLSSVKRYVTDVDSKACSDPHPMIHGEGRVRHASVGTHPTSRDDRQVLRQVESRTIFDLDWRYFWKWTRFIDYVVFMVMFCVAGGVLTYFLSSFSAYVETLGFLAVFTEAMLGSPQFYHNFRNKSTQGMSVKMVMCWLSGDLFKTGYFFVNDAPTQFWICGILQVSIDIAILTQVVFYGARPPIKLAKVAAPADHIS